MANLPINALTHATKMAVDVLQFFADQSKITFNRPLALRTVTEVVRAIPGVEVPIWSRRLAEAGESLNLRIRNIDLSKREAIRLVQQGIPMVACYTADDETGLRVTKWIALSGFRRRKVRIHRFDGGGDGWVRTREVAALLEASESRRELSWMTGQTTLPCAVETVDSSNLGAPIKPMERLFAIIRADRKDLWAVVIFSVVVGILALAVPITVEALVNTVAFGRYLQPIVVLSGILFTLLGFAAAIRALNTYIVEIIQRRLFVRVVEDVAYRLPRVEQEAIDDDFGPELVNRFLDIATVQKLAAKLLLDGLSMALQAVLGMAVLAFYHPFLLGFDVALMASIGFITFGLGRNAVRTAIVESKTKYKVAAWLEELARHPTAFKLNGGAQLGTDRAGTLVVNYLDARRAHFRILMRQVLFALGLQAIAATALLGMGGWLVIRGELTLGQLVAAELIVMNIVGSFAKIGKHLEGFYDLLASVDKLGQLFDLPIEKHDKLFHLGVASPATLSLRGVTQVVGGAAFHHGLTLEIESSDSLAVVGPAASGKSILFDLLIGVRHPSDGHITLDGIDLRELRPDSLREHVAIARGSEVFYGTIEENVHLNRPQINASDVRLALETVHLLDEIMRLPDGVNTHVQTNGAPLTESQSRRLMIARAIVSRPRLLLVDGTFDSLSDEIALEILQKVRENPPWTLVVATGRREIAQALDRVLDLTDNSVTVNISLVGHASAGDE